MKVGIVGAGSVGCYYGSRLLRAGVSVIFVTKAEHAAAIRNTGIICDAGHGRTCSYPDVSADFSVLQEADIILVCVKACDTDSVVSKLAPHIRAKTHLLSLQNGVETAERMRRLLGRPVSPVILYTATELIASGHVIHHGGNEVLLSQDLHSSNVAGLFLRGGFSVQFCEDLPKALWEKLALNCACNALSAALQKPYGHFLNTDRLRPTLHAIVEECRTVADGFGLSLPLSDCLLDRIFDLSKIMPTQYSSMAHDLMKGKRTEVDALNGFIVRTGETMGIATPVNRVLWDMVTLLSEHVPPSAQSRTRLEPMFSEILAEG